MSLSSRNDSSASNAILKESMNEVQKINRRLNRILEAVKAQANDETLWTPKTVYEAHTTQSLRWLHELIEKDSDVAINNIVQQSRGDI